MVPDDPGGALSFSRLWTATTVGLARQAGTTVGLVDDTTFMGKLEPSSIEIACGLGEAGGADQLRRFSFQRAHGAAFYAMRRGLASELGVRLAGVAAAKLDFIDGFHFARSLALQADAVAAAMA